MNPRFTSWDKRWNVCTVCKPNTSYKMTSHPFQESKFISCIEEKVDVRPYFAQESVMCYFHKDQYFFYRNWILISLEAGLKEFESIFMNEVFCRSSDLGVDDGTPGVGCTGTGVSLWKIPEEKEKKKKKEKKRCLEYKNQLLLWNKENKNTFTYPQKLQPEFQWTYRLQWWGKCSTLCSCNEPSFLLPQSFSGNGLHWNPNWLKFRRKKIYMFSLDLFI